MKIDKINGDVKYNDEKHIYWDENGTFISVTTLIGFYKNKFDSEFWASYKALEALLGYKFEEIKYTLLNTKIFNITLIDKFNISEQDFNNKKQEILLEYEEKKNVACDRGTQIHAEFENKYYTKKTHDLSDKGFKGNFTCTPNYYELNLDKGIYPEYLIALTSSDGLLKVAGQIDLLIKDGNDIYIWDYKSNKKLDTKSYYNKKTKRNEILKFPLHNIQDCNVMHYTLQLSLYAYLLQQINPEFNIKELKLIHIDHENKKSEIVVDYLKKDVERMLKHYKQHILIQKEISKDVPIQY